MKKQLILTALLASTLYSQAQTFSTQSSLISMGSGLGIIDKCSLSSKVPGYVITDVHHGLPLYLKYEHGVTDDIGIGVYYAHVNSTASSPYAGFLPIIGSSPKMSTSIFGLAGYYHFNRLLYVPHLDFYAGIGLVIRNQSYSDLEGYEPPATQALPIIKVGARYYFIHHLSAFLELSADGLSPVNVGLTVNLKNLF